MIEEKDIHNPYYYYSEMTLLKMQIVESNDNRNSLNI